MADYDKSIGRLRVRYIHDYGSGMCVSIFCVDGWNDSCATLENSMSLEEVRDLRYLLDRMLAAAGDPT